MRPEQRAKNNRGGRGNMALFGRGVSGHVTLWRVCNLPVVTSYEPHACLPVTTADKTAALHYVTLCGGCLRPTPSRLTF